MRKGLIIGMTALCVGSAVAGGVGGYFINKATTKTNNPQQSITEYSEYDVPDVFSYSSPSVYSIGDNFALFSSSSAGTYLLNKETNKFEYFSSGYIQSVSDKINGDVYVWLSTSRLFKFNIKDGTSNAVSLNSGVSFNSLAFISSNMNGKLGFLGYGNSKYYFCVYDIENQATVKYGFSSLSYSSSYNFVLETNNYYCIGIDYVTGHSSSYDAPLYIFDKNMETFSTISKTNFYGLENILVKDDVLYGLFTIGSSYGKICSIDLTTSTMTVFTNSTNTNYFYSSSWEIQEYENGFILGSTISGSNYDILLCKFEDNSVTSLGKGSTYTLNGQTLYGFVQDGYGCVGTFNEETETFDVLYKSFISASSSSAYCSFDVVQNQLYFKFYDGNSIYYYTKILNAEDGSLEFTNLSITGYLPIYDDCYYSLGDNKYIVHSGKNTSVSTYYYDFDTDTYKQLFYSTSSFKEIKEENGKLYIYTTDGCKYEFNQSELSVKLVKIYE